MRNNKLTVHISLLSYNILIECKINKLNITENTFYQKLIAAVKELKLLPSTIDLESNFYSEFLDKAKNVCEFEALTFLPDESRNEYQLATQELAAASNYIFAQYDFPNAIFKEAFISHWRIFISAVTTFMEWCSDINFYKFSEPEQFKILQESPLISLCHL